MSKKEDVKKVEEPAKKVEEVKKKPEPVSEPIFQKLKLAKVPENQSPPTGFPQKTQA